MEEQTHTYTKITAILLTILFVITGVFAILIYNTAKLAFDPNVYKQALSSTGIYQRLPELLGEQIVYSLKRNPCIQNPIACSQEQLNAAPAYLSSVDTTEWELVLSGLIDSDWFKLQMESVIDQVLIFISTPGQTLQLDISLVELKTRLGGEEGYQAILNLLNSLEPCTFGDLINLPTAILNTDDPVNLPLCRPSESVLTLSENAIRDSLKVIADKLPNNTSSLIGNTMPGVESGLAVTQRSLQLLRTLARLSPILPLCLLLIITLLVVRNLESFLKWWGIPIVSIAGLVFVCSLMLTPVVRTFVSTRVNVIGLAPGWIDAIRDAILQATLSFRNLLNLQAGILLAVGCLMLFASALVRSRSN